MRKPVARSAMADCIFVERVFVAILVSLSHHVDTPHNYNFAADALSARFASCFLLIVRKRPRPSPKGLLESVQKRTGACAMTETSRFECGTTAACVSICLHRNERSPAITLPMSARSASCRRIRTCHQASSPASLSGRGSARPDLANRTGMASACKSSSAGFSSFRLVRSSPYFLG